MERLKTVRPATPVMHHITALCSPLSTERRFLHTHIINITQEINALISGPVCLLPFFIMKTATHTDKINWA